MTLLYIDWGYVYDDHIIREWENKGIVVKKRKYLWNTDPLFWENNKFKKEKEETRIVLEKEADSSIDLVFSVNFISAVSDWCQDRGIPYASWVLELPNFDLYTQSIYNDCNYMGICDSYLVEKLLQAGVRKVFLLPDAVNIDTEKPQNYEEREFCYIAKRPKKLLTIQEVSLYTRGYLEAFLHVQRVIPGEAILEEGLLNRVYQELLQYNTIPESILSAMEKLYFADYYLNPECMALRENIFLQNNSNLITIYSDEEFSMCEGRQYPYVEEEKKRKEIYAKKEFSLILTPYTNHHGMDRTVLEVISAGGFPVCSYQKDYDFFFKKDKNLTYFTNRNEFVEIITHYGNNPEEREALLTEAYNQVKDHHTYNSRIDTMLYFWEKLS